MKSVELFAGAGGLAIGIHNAGFRHAAVVERDRWCCDTIRENPLRKNGVSKKWPLHEADTRSITSFGELGSSITLLSGGPPCQPFSLGGKHRGNSDDRDMFPEVVRAIRELQPKAIIVENVKGLLRQSFATYFGYIYLQMTYPEIIKKKGEDWTQHLSRLQQHHSSGSREGLVYQINWQLLNAANFGVPQRRERVFFVGFRSDLGIEWSFENDMPETHSLDRLLWDQWVSSEYWRRNDVPRNHIPGFPDRFKSRISMLENKGRAPGSKPWKTVREALVGLPNPRLNPNSNFPNHRQNPGARTYKGHTGSPLDGPAKTLKAGDHGVPGGENMLAYRNGKVRYFTIREAARLQTFPDDYILHGAWSEAMRQLGNAVPVKLAEVVAKSVHGRLSTM